jgi:hypothetical protein
MASAPIPSPSVSSEIPELLEVAFSILENHRDDDLSQKLFVMQQYLEISDRYPEGKYREGLKKSIADLTSAVHRHLNDELHAAATLFIRFNKSVQAQDKQNI